MIQQNVLLGDEGIGTFYQVLPCEINFLNLKRTSEFAGDLQKCKYFSPK